MTKQYHITLAGNPNVGKSTVFNALTGLKQHTGNWPGKTVACAQGEYSCCGDEYFITDLPGTYSLFPHSREEEIARDHILFSHPDAVIVVCDATSLERGLNLLLQTMELTGRVILCINLMDEAARKHITIYSDLLEELLGIPVVCTSARSKKGLSALQSAVRKVCTEDPLRPKFTLYDDCMEKQLDRLIPILERDLPEHLSSRFAALRLLESDRSFYDACKAHGIIFSEEIRAYAVQANCELDEMGLEPQEIKDRIVECIYAHSARLCKKCVVSAENTYDRRREKLDRILTGKRTGIPIMLGLLALIFWITLSASNYPSAFLSRTLLSLQEPMYSFLTETLGAPLWLGGALIHGIYRVLVWVVSVMLPPMMIFFPLFTLLEDLGYLPRVAFNLDKCFCRCRACGKQALTMCMGFGCNAVGVTGCRIIDSPRERRIAILTNSLVPCNGRFPRLFCYSH